MHQAEPARSRPQPRTLVQGLAAVSARLEPKEAREAATTLTQAMTKTMHSAALQQLAQGLAAVLTRETPELRRQRFQSVAALFGPTLTPTLGIPAPVVMQPALEPLPEPLPPQLLVDLLKQPLCVGEARRLVLEQLARHYGRAFADQWDFVRFVQEQKLDLDLSTPPRRPGSQQ